jgi:hypothetical protein
VCAVSGSAGLGLDPDHQRQRGRQWRDDDRRDERDPHVLARRVGIRVADVDADREQLGAARVVEAADPHATSTNRLPTSHLDPV